MRIVAGTFRGRPLVAPKGHSTRPTADRVRQAVFNILEHAAWSPGLTGLRVVDIFAGSGALGLEALSRSAGFCLFVDNDPAARAAIAGNVQSLGLVGRAEIQTGDAVEIRAAAPFDLAFLDPPYGLGLDERALSAMADRGILKSGAIAVVERGVGDAPLAAPGYEMLDERAWGTARVSFLQFRAASGR